VIFDPSGHGTAMRSMEVAKAMGYGPVEKGRFDATARAGRKAARINRRGGTFIQRHVTRPATADFQATVDDAIRNAQRAAEETTRNATNAGQRATKRGALYLASGIGGGIGGGMTVGYGAKRAIDPDRKRQQRRNRSQYALAKADSYDDFRNRVLADVNGIPPWRRNPISPLQMVAASNMIGEGLADIRSRNPFFRRRRTIRGVQQMAMGQQMAYRGVGES
jgi:hypothetical protein